MLHIGLKILQSFVLCTLTHCGSLPSSPSTERLFVAHSVYSGNSYAYTCLFDKGLCAFLKYGLDGFHILHANLPWVMYTARTS